MGTTLEDSFPKAWVYDVEVFVNLFTAVFRKLGTKQYHKFVIHAEQNDSQALVDFLTEEQPVLIGFNNLAFDGQLLHKVFLNPGITAEQIYAFSQDLIEKQGEDRFYVPCFESQLSQRQIDLFKQNHYDNTSRLTSLKWLEFTLRWYRMEDMPFHHSKEISRSNISKVLSYNHNDVDVTHEFFYRCEGQTLLRLELARKYRNPRLLSMSDSSMGAFIFKELLGATMDKSKLKKGSPRGKIAVRDCMLPYLQFRDPDLKQLLQEYSDIVIDVKKTGLKGIIDKKVVFSDIQFSFGTGGIHGAYLPGIYDSDNDHEILSIDGKSFYPWLIIANGFYPEHLGPAYCDVYRQVYDMRTGYAKGTSMNYALKIVLNSVYGKSNSEYSYLYDPKLTLQITINGQMLLMMLAERLSRAGRLLLINTDGIDIRVQKKNLAEVKEICEQWEALTGITLEENKYQKIVIRDVNSYIAVDLEGKAKRKGFFTTYEDIIGGAGEEHGFHKNPSANIIPMALYQYFINGVPIEETVLGHNNIHDFLYGIKSKKNFDYWFIRASPEGVVDIEKRNDRVLRYFISRHGSNIFKHFSDNRVTNPIGVNKGQLIELAMTIGDTEINGVVKTGKYAGQPLDNYSDLNRDHYINECYKILDQISHGEQATSTTEEEAP